MRYTTLHTAGISRTGRRDVQFDQAYVETQK